MGRLSVFVCSFGYVGFFPVAPGTAGSAAGIVVYLVMKHLGVVAAPIELSVIAAMFVVGVWLGTHAEKQLGCVDPGPVVLDEVMGMLLTVALVPVSGLGLLLGFFLFRALDIVKPYPARQFERLPGGLGLMADDAMAAVYGNLLLRAACYFLPALRS